MNRWRDRDGPGGGHRIVRVPRRSACRYAGSSHDKAYLSAKFAQALRDLGHPVDAEGFARASLQMSDGYDRGRLFNTALLASILADGGKVDESVAVAREALHMAGRVRSVRAQNYLREAGVRLMPYVSTAEVKELHREMFAAGVTIR